MKKLAALILSLFFVSAFAKGPSPKIKNDTIVWTVDSLLRHEDFKAKPKANAALGLSSIGIRLYSGEVKGELVFFVKAVFMKSQSYLVGNSDYVLKHEQTHFDISEVYARTIRKKIAQLDFAKIKSTSNEMTKLYESTMRDYFKEQERYDKDTEHGLNPVKQKAWNEDIAQRLQDLNAFSAWYVNVTK